MKKYRLSYFICFTLIFLCILPGCSQEQKYDTFYNSVVSKNGNYCFRNLTKGMTWEEVQKKEKIEHETIGKSAYETYITESAVYFEELGISFRRGYTFDGFDHLESANYVFITDNEDELREVCAKLADFARERLKSNPMEGSAEMIAVLPTKEEAKTNLVTRWYDKSEDGTSLEIWVHPYIANGKRVRITVRY